MKFIAIMIYACHACDAISHFCFLSLRLHLHVLFPFMQMSSERFNLNGRSKICVKLFMSFDTRRK